MKRQLVGILGGTFDPIHLGHTWVASQLLSLGLLEEILFVPCHTPVHKNQSIASPMHRETMLKLAIDDMPNTALCRYELEQEKPVYMHNTMAHIASDAICPVLIVGTDVWQTFHRWKHPESILEAGHILVINRPDYPWPPTMPQNIFSETAISHDGKTLKQRANGSICLQKLDFPSAFYDNFSSSSLRQQLSCNQLPTSRINPQVLEYCLKHQLYRK